MTTSCPAFIRGILDTGTVYGLTRAEIDARIRELRQLVTFEEELPA